jgi:hypothetical protein
MSLKQISCWKSILKTTSHLNPEYSLYQRNPPWPFEAGAYITVLCYLRGFLSQFWPTLKASGNTLKLTQHTVIRFLGGPYRHTIHDDSLNERTKTHTTHGDRPFRGLLSKFRLILKTSGNTVKLTQPTVIRQWHTTRSDMPIRGS